jgi:hypothetical protein
MNFLHHRGSESDDILVGGSAMVVTGVANQPVFPSVIPRAQATMIANIKIDGGPCVRASDMADAS